MPEVEPEKRRLRVRRFLPFARNQQEQRSKTTPTPVLKDDASHASVGSTTPVSDGANLNKMQQTDSESSQSRDSCNTSTSAPKALHDSTAAAILSSTEAKRYKEAVDKLRKILSDTKGIDQFPVEMLELPCTVADIDGVVKSMSSAIADFVETREKLKQNKSQLRGIVETCYKTSLPFVQGSLNIVTVLASGSLFDHSRVLYEARIVSL